MIMYNQEEKAMKRRHDIRNIVVLTASIAASVAMTTAALDAADDATSILRQTSSAFTAIAKKTVPAVVFIEVEKDVEMGGGHPGFYNDPHQLYGDDFLRRFFGQENPHQSQPRKFRQMGQGSGFLISKDGYILTNNHVVGDADRIRVTLKDGRKLDAERIGSDSKSEVAVIRIKGNDFPYLELGDSESLEIGEWVIAVGTPFGLAETVTAGIVSAKGRSNIGIADYESFIQTDAAINPGNSGGPLLNIDGKVVGVNTAIYSRTGGYMGIGFAIPIKMAVAIKDQLVKTGKVVRGYLGIYIQEVDTDLAESFGMKKATGILVSQVMPDSAADKAGLQEEDVILELNGHEVSEVGSFRNEVASHVPGSKLKLSIWRDGKEIKMTAETGTLPGEEEGAEEVAAKVSERLGFDVLDLTAEIAAHTGYEEGEGVIVSEVDLGSAAWQAGIRQGTLITSVNREGVSNASEFQGQMAKIKEGDVVLLKIRDGRATRYITLR
jgi:serine protease Do